MPEKQKYFLYFSEPISSTIIESQVVNWLEQFQKSNIIFNACFMDALSVRLTEKDAYRKRKQQTRKRLRGKVYFLPVIRRKDTFGLRQVYVFVYLFMILSVQVLFKRKIAVIQTRVIDYYKAFNYLKQALPNINIILDYRGARSEEYINSLNYSTIDEVEDNVVRENYFRQIKIQKNFFRIASNIVCVSNALKLYVIDTFGSEFSDKTIVIPGAADESHFFFDPGTRQRIRDKFGLQNKKVLVYTGQLAGYYHLAEKVMKFADLFTGIDQAHFFLCLTPDIALAENFIKKSTHLSEKKSLVRYAKHLEINDYLCAGDVAIILRKKIKTNMVASPTKIPEYLLCGLPLLLSPYIGDFSEFISGNKMGIIINNDDLENGVRECSQAMNTFLNRQEIREKAKILYSKQAVADKYIQLYSNI